MHQNKYFLTFSILVLSLVSLFENKLLANENTIVLNSMPIVGSTPGLGSKNNLLLVIDKTAIYLTDPFIYNKVNLDSGSVNRVKLEIENGAMVNINRPMRKGNEDDFYFDEVLQQGRRKRIVRFSLSGKRIGEFSNYIGPGGWSISPWGEIIIIQSLVQRLDNRPAHLLRGSLTGELIDKTLLSSNDIGTASGFIYGLTFRPIFVREYTVIVSIHGPQFLLFSREGTLLKKGILDSSLITDYISRQLAFKVKGAMSGLTNLALHHAMSDGEKIYVIPFQAREKILAFDLEGKLTGTYEIKSDKSLERGFWIDTTSDNQGSPVFVAIIEDELCVLEAFTDSGNVEAKQ